MTINIYFLVMHASRHITQMEKNELEYMSVIKADQK
jgi:hypothetical protein